MSVLGDLASGIYVNEFDSSNTYGVSINSISGWLESNLGLLNTMLNCSFSADGSDVNIQAQAIHKEIYLYNYYQKQSRNALRGIIASSGDNVLSVKDSESQVTFVNKNEVSKVYRGLASDSKINIDKLVAQYNIYESEPRQVGGIESMMTSGYYGSYYNRASFI